MKKLTLNAGLLSTNEVLTRAQLKKVFGGTGSGSGSSSCSCELKSGGNWYPVELNPVPTTEQDCSSRCESTYNTVIATGGSATSYRSIWATNNP